MSAPLCIRCGGEIDRHMIESKARVEAKLGRHSNPPKVCSGCLWRALVEMDEEEGEGNEA